MNTDNELDREAIIQYIIANDPKVSKEELEKLSLGALVLIKVHIEIGRINLE